MITAAFGIVSHPLGHTSGLLREPLNRPPQSPFDSVENAHQYVRLLVEAIAEAKSEIAADLDATELGAAAPALPERRLEALRLVQFKLDKLEQHLQSSSRLLNDLRTLRRLLFDERSEPAPAGQDSDG
ncbi:MAG: hypothetical protein WCA13_00470 [Terriglobales bacterium]